MAFLFVFTFFFNMIYSLANERAIYPNMNWFKSPEFGVLWLFGLIIVIVPLVHLLVFGLNWLREIIDMKCFKKGPTNLVLNMHQYYFTNTIF